MHKSDLTDEEFEGYHTHYINHAPNSTLQEALKSSMDSWVSLVKSIPQDKYEYAYDSGKWTLKDMLGHIIDTERIFTYRALRISRGDKTALQGYDHNDFVRSANSNSRSIDSLLEEYQTQRKNTVLFFKNLSSDMLLQIGNANGLNISARALGFLISGHEIHHLKVYKEKYL